ncbi:MAG: head GIN domain-containing protein [Flavobacterium sp.]
MKKLVFGLLFISSIAFAQIEKEVGDFTKVTAFDKIDVLLVKSNENKVLLVGKDAGEVELVNKNGELKIRMAMTKMLSGDGISATVYFKNIEAVEANEGSGIGCGDLISATFFEIIAKEGSHVKLKIDAEKLKAKVVNGSKIEMEGKAKNQDVVVNSGGIYEAEKLKTEQTVVSVTAGGEADIYATDFVDAKVRAGGNITIFGKPKQINQKTIAGGTIEQVK